MATVIGHAQCELKFRSLSYFRQDTTAFLVHNFMDRRDCYKGKTVVRLFKDLEIRMSTVIWDAPDTTYIKGVYLQPYNIYQAKKLSEGKKEPNKVYIRFEEPMDYKKTISKIKKNSSNYSLYKDVKIESVHVILSEHGKYYEKYKHISK